MKGYFTSATTLVVGDVTHKVRLACVIPAFYLETILYEFVANSGEEFVYLNRFLGWSRRPFSRDLSKILFKGQDQKLTSALLNPQATLRDFGPIKSPEHNAIAWRDFPELELARALTGEWRLYSLEVIMLLRARNFRLLAFDHQFDLNLHLVKALRRDDELLEDLRLYRLVWDLVAAHGPLVSTDIVTERMHELGGTFKRLLNSTISIDLETKTVTLTWIRALLARLPPIISAYVATLEQVKALFPTAQAFPARGPCKVLICPGWLSALSLVSFQHRPSEGIILFGDPCHANDRHMMRRDLMLASLPTKWLDEKGGDWVPIPFLTGVFPPRKTGVFRLTEPDTRKRFKLLLDHFKPKEAKGGDKRILIAFSNDDPVERDRYECSQFARTSNYLCVARQRPELPLFSVIFKGWGKKGPFYKHRGKRLSSIGDTIIEPLAMCRAILLPVLKPEDFDVVILIGDAATPVRWVHEAVRVGSEGATVLCGV